MTDQTINDTRLNQVVQTVRAVIATLDDDGRCVLDEVRNEGAVPLRAHNQLFEAQQIIGTALGTLWAAVSAIEEVLPVAYIPDVTA